MTEPIPTTESNPEIKLDGVFENFYDHFSKPGNSRILFTAPFGMGKTYFLNRFFKDFLNEREKQNGEDSKEYVCIRVSPVNYVPSDNVTIFELIKVDILRQLFFYGDLKIDNRKLKSSYYKATLKYVKRQPLALVDLIADLLPLLSIDPVTNPVLSGIKDMAKSTTNFLREIQKVKLENDEALISNGEKAIAYEGNMEVRKGTHLEFDLISEIIFKTIEKSEKKFVLVVDDLDRLDPAHIFRLLNIFSAHNNFEEKNKFGFDKVITVCDLVNIEVIFHHFYGEKTEFRGYIDKFVSFNPYEFENFENILNFVKNNNSNQILKDFNLVLSIFVYSGIKEGHTNLRSLVSSFKLKNVEDGFIDVFNYRIDKTNLAFIHFTKFIRQLYAISFFSSKRQKLLSSNKLYLGVLNSNELRQLRDQIFKMIGFILFKNSDFLKQRWRNVVTSEINQDFGVSFNHISKIKEGNSYLIDYELNNLYSRDFSRQIEDGKEKEFLNALSLFLIHEMNNVDQFL
jgi:hypothetical protein